MGKLDIPLFLAKKENILLYIRLLEARSYTPTLEEMERTPTPEERLKQAQKNKEDGNIFFGRKVYKLAYDHYCYAMKNIKYKESVYEKLPANIKSEITQLKSNLLRNFAAYYVEEKNWTEALNYCNMALSINKQCIPSLIRRSRIYAEIEKFDKSKQDFMVSLELDKDKKHIPALNLTKNRYKCKYAEYKSKLQHIENNMAKHLMSGDSVFITEMTKSALEDLANKEY